MKIIVRHLSTEIIVDEAVDPGFATQYGTSHPTKMRFTDDHPYVIKTLEKMVDEVVRLRSLEGK